MKTILVVDDNKLNLATAKQVLSGEYKVIPVMRGDQALTYLENNECDIILLDIYMPEMDGFEVLKKIQEMPKCQNIPVIFLTADTDVETETRCFKEGAVDFIAKPFVPDIMLSRISRALELEELRRSLADRLAAKTREVSAIKDKSHQDALTGLWDRIYTEEAVNQMLTNGTQGALLMLDIDNFKSVNDHYGHIAGDKTLQMLSEVMQQVSSASDILCRIGGDEFMFFVKDKTDKNNLSTLASNIIADFRAKINEFGFKTNTSISIGIARSPENGTEFVTLYNCADKALYHVKQNGKNSYHFFSEKLQAENSNETVDLRYLQDLMSRADNGMGTYHLDFESFHYVYNFIHRSIDRASEDIQMLLFTVAEKGDEQLAVSEIDYALELLEKAIHTSLRRSDVATRYSGKQIIVILMDINKENGNKVAKRILTNFNALYPDEKVSVQYDIARMGSQL